MTDKLTLLRPTARCPGPTWQELLDSDSRPVPAFVRADGYSFLGSDPLSVARYTSAEFSASEKERMWPYVWQMAARDEELLEPGDFAVYDNVGRSYLIVRQNDGSVRAFHNVCLHRGRKLQLASGSVSEFRCPFHGFSWNNDGTLRDIPCRWDFPHLDDSKMSLPEVEVGRWGGYIFIREKSGGPTLQEYLSPVPEHFERWRHEDCTTAIWVAKIVAANWKVVMEAFMEAYHTMATHPQLLPFTGDANAAYNVWGDNVNANYVPFGILSPHLANGKHEEQWIVDEFVKFNGRSVDNYDRTQDEFAIKVPTGVKARAALGEVMRERSKRAFIRDHGDITDSEMVDAFVYNIFPNFSPWGGFMPSVVYRWRPGADQDHSIMDVRILTRVPPGQPKPPAVPMRMLDESESWSTALELGVLGSVFDQDMDNLPYVQEGLKASANGVVQLGNYQEIRIRHFQMTLDKYLNR